MKEINRREFLRFATTITAGAAVGEFLPPVKEQVDEIVEEATGHPTGNAGFREEIAERCQNSENAQKCRENYEFPPADKVMGIVTGPITEEIYYRALPSAVLSKFEDTDHLFADILSGTGRLTMSRRELLFGAISSLVFGLTHNITNKGFDTKTIPASLTLSGAVYWYLQRKFGVVANTLAHIWNNFKTMT